MRTAPPTDMVAALASPATKQAAVNWVFDTVARRYDLGNHVISAGMHRRWKRRLADMASIEPHHRVLDIACGTGDITYLAAARAWDGRVVGTDINPTMLRLARAKRPTGCHNVTFQEADAGALPFDDHSFDRVTCVFAGRGFPDWRLVIAEAYRVLVPGGQFWNLDFARPPAAAIDLLYRGWLFASGAVLGLALNGNAQTYMYIPRSMRQYRGQRWLDAELRAAGFETRLVESRLCLMAFNGGAKPR